MAWPAWNWNKIRFSRPSSNLSVPLHPNRRSVSVASNKSEFSGQSFGTIPSFRQSLYRGPRAAFLRTTLLSAAAILLLVSLTSALATAAVSLWAHFFPAHPLPPMPAIPPWRTYPPLPRLRFLLAALLLAPACEELLFRGLLQSALLRSLPPRAAYPLVALPFALLHGLTPAILPLFVLSLLLSRATRAAGLLSPFLLHSAYNLFVLLAAEFTLHP